MDQMKPLLPPRKRSDLKLIAQLLFEDHPSPHNNPNYKTFSCASCKQSFTCHVNSANREKTRHADACPLAQASKRRLLEMADKGMLEKCVNAAISDEQRQHLAHLQAARQAQVQHAVATAPKPSLEAENAALRQTIEQMRVQANEHYYHLQLLHSFYRVFRTSTFFDDMIQLNTGRASVDQLADLQSLQNMLVLWRSHDPKLVDVKSRESSLPLDDFRDAPQSSLSTGQVPNVMLTDNDLIDAARQSVKAFKSLQSALAD